MKTIKIILCIVISASFACNDLVKKVEGEEERISANLVNNPITAGEEKKDEPLPELTFKKLRHNFGEITQGESVSHQFTFTNTGEGDLIINNAKGSCGCTVPTWPREPIMPGVSDKIKVKYATNRVGKFTKTITISTNSADKKPVILTVKGEVLPPPKDAAAPEKNTEGAPLENK